ncbi:MAG: MaoC family dehydratase [Actinomycetota bacterium]|nr:MaoC family dehydratase [Actinomycetota bacterium]
MGTTVSWDDVEVGTELPPVTIALRREDLVRYAGASGDLNPIHWSDRVARAVGLPDVIAHGMLTMGQAARVLTGWLGDPGGVLDYSVRFTRPVIVPDDDEGARVELSGRVTEKLDARRVRVELSAVFAGSKVLGQARAVVQLA